MESTSDLWDTLVLGVDSLTWDSLRKLIEEVWPKVVGRLAELEDIEVAGPSQAAWFHVRRATIGNRGVEVLRLRRGVLASQDSESIRLLGEAEKTVRWARWCPEEFKDCHDNAFLSFLQKLSVLRVIQGICYKEYLAEVSAEYDKCRCCQRAYRVMTSQDKEWYGHLSPWVEYMKSTQMRSVRTHEYAHWFGHIISGWPNPMLPI